MNLIEPMQLWTSIITMLIQQLRYLNAYYKFNLLLKNFQASSSSRDANIFDELPALSAPASLELHDELECYLTTDPEQVSNVCAWWYEQREAYPRLHRIVKDSDIAEVVMQPEIPEEDQLAEGWDL